MCVRGGGGERQREREREMNGKGVAEGERKTQLFLHKLKLLESKENLP